MGKPKEFITKLLSEEKTSIYVAQELLDTPNTDLGFLNTVITGDESWMYGKTQNQKIVAIKAS